MAVSVTEVVPEPPVNRYIYLLSAIFSRAAIDEFVDFNPCSRLERESEVKRERYLTPAERTKLMDVLVDDLEVLHAPVEVSLGTGVRKITELLELRIENVNFTGLSIFRRANGRDVEVRPNWFLLTNTKGQEASSSSNPHECSCAGSIACSHSKKKEWSGV